MPLKVLCDENLPGAVIAALQKLGFEVRRVVPKTPDEEIAAQARREGRVILTFDSDFSNVLAYPPAELCGIVRIKIDPPFISVVIPALTRVFDAFPTADHLRGKLVIAEAGTFRVWEPPPGPA